MNWKTVFTIVLFLVACFFIYFYRKPSTQIIRQFNDTFVYSPAFGTIKKIEKLDKTNQLFIAIFLSPIDIHYQYMPIRGTVMSIKHDDIGVYHLAFDMEKSKDNEKMIYQIQTKQGTLVLYQIAGFLVHRISTDLEVGKTYETGEQVGMIKFGSRVDILIPNADRFHLNKKCIVNATVNPDTIFGSYD